MKSWIVLNIVLILLPSTLLFAQTPADDLTPDFKAPVLPKDYQRRVMMIPMRDGVRLNTVIYVPEEAIDAPIVLTRTCYGALERSRRLDAPTLIETLPLSDEPFVRNGYIRVYQDVRGKYGSEGVYLMTPPPIGPYNL